MGIKKMVIIKSLEHPGQNPHFRLAKLSRLCTIRSAPWVSYATGFSPTAARAAHFNRRGLAQ